MASVLYIFLCLLCFFSFKRTNSAKVYVLDFPNADDTSLLNNYDDYDPINEFAEDTKNSEMHPLKLNIQKSNPLSTDTLNIRCHRLFGSMYGNGNQQIRCRENLHKNERSIVYARSLKRKMPEFFKDPLITKPSQSYGKLQRFSQDYLDVRDLERADLGFEDFRGLSGSPCDYLDFDSVGDLAKHDCLVSYNSGTMKYPYF